MSLEPFIGEWGFDGFDGGMSFEWLFGGRFVVQRATISMEAAPDVLAVIAPDGDGYRQHYFDSRGVVRVYDMTFDGRLWTLSRTTPDFSDFNFHQRYFGEFSDDGRRIDGRWEISHDMGKTWELDFPLVYVRR